MMARKLFFQLFSLGLILAMATVSVYAAPDNMGTEFNFAFQNNYDNSSELSLLITSERDTQGVVEIPSLAYRETFSVQANQITKIVIPSAAQVLPDIGKADLGVFVSALDEIGVYGINQRKFTSDAFLAIPSEVLDDEYLVLSYFGIRNWYYPSEIAIVGTVDGTVVDIVPKQNLGADKPAGKTFTITLNRNEVYQFSSQLDLTGSYIKSTEPVAVMSGVSCADVPDTTPRIGWCDHLAEMMLPLSAWGKSFLTVPLATRLKGDVIRILASENNTEVRINGSLAATLNRGDFHEEIVSERAYIQASAPVMVSQYATGQGFDGVAADPFMAVLPANEQFLSSYVFATPESGFERNYVNIVIPGGSAIASLRLDGTLVDPLMFSPIGDSGYEGAQIPVSVGSHSITADVPFGLLVYGFNSFDSYGYPGGLALAITNPLEDPFAPNFSAFKHVGYTFFGSATDSEDSNANGILDAGEDLNNNGLLDRRTEDANGNGVLDEGEDINGNGFLDADRGIWRVELLAGAENLRLEVLDFIAGQSPSVNFSVSLDDNTQPGAGTLRVIDLAKNATDIPIFIPSSPALSDLNVINTVSGDHISVDRDSFSYTPVNISETPDGAVIEWYFESFLANRIQDLAYDVILKDPVPGETRKVTQKVELNYVDLSGKRVSSELGPQYVNVSASAFSLTVGADRQNYGPDSSAELSSVVKNLGTSTGTVSLELLIEDGNGVLVKKFEPRIFTGIAPGAAVTENISWNTGNLITGNYQIRAIVRSQEARFEGDIVNEAIQPFAIVSSTAGIPQMSADLTVGRDIGGAFVQQLVYNTDDLVQVQQRITNMTVNAYIAGATVQTRVMNSSGQIIFSKDSRLNALAPGAIADLYVSVPITSADPGSYTVQSLVTDDNTAAILASNSAQFTVQQNIARSLQGAVVLQSDEVLLGDDQACTDTVSNLTAFGVNDATLQLSLIRLDTQEEIRSQDMLVSVAPGETQEISRVETTSNLVAGEYVCVLRAEIDGEFRTLNLNVFNVYNLIADPGADQSALVGDIVTLDGSNSREASNLPLSYQWKFLSVPEDSNVTLSDPDTAQPSFIVDQQGVYILQLIVNNGIEDSMPKTVSIFVANRKAVANAGLDQSVQVGDLVALDGSNSSDLDGDPLSFKWTLIQKPAGSTTEISDVNSVNPTIFIDVPGIYIAELVVNDGFEPSDPDTVLLNVGNVPPVADAGENLAAQLGDLITLDGSASHDANGDMLSYRWQFVSKPTGSVAGLSSRFDVKPSFTVDVAGDYVIELIVRDGLEQSDPDRVTVTVGNSAPLADAGPDLPANIGQTMTLDGSASSDLDGDTLRYRWSLLGKPEGSNAQLSNPFTENPQFYVDKQGDYIVQLVVNDGTVDSKPDLAVIRVGNVRPVARAYFDSEGEFIVGEEVLLSGRSSYDPDGDPITYQWNFSRIPFGSKALLENANSPYPRFIPDMPGTYVIQLVVNDGLLDSEPTSLSMWGVQYCVENLAIRPKSQKAQLTWTDYEGSGTTSYVILRSRNIDGPYYQLDEYGEDSLDYYRGRFNYLDSGLSNGETYYYRIQRTFTPWWVAELSELEYLDRCGDGGVVFDGELVDSYGLNSGEENCDSTGLECGGGEVYNECIQQCTSQILATMPSYRVRMTYVPDLYGMSEAQAMEKLAQARLVVGQVTTERTTAVPPGQVVKQDAPRQSVLPQGTAVDIVLSTR